MSGRVKKALKQLQPDPVPGCQADCSGAGTPAEFVEFVEFARSILDIKSKKSASHVERSGNFDQPAIFPADSVLADWMAYARMQVESADIFLLGCILAVCAAMLARRIWFAWGYKRKYANVFNILAGKPGDRKSSAILLALALSQKLLPSNAYIPKAFSPESLFDAYAEDKGGRADKLWVVDDANGVLKDWEKTVNGERVATRFLELYDCTGMSESFRQNKRQSEDGSTQRVVPETSTSVVFGATFQIAAFQRQEIRAGMARRFLYYIAERHGRLIERPSAGSAVAFEALAEGFRPLGELEGELDFDAEAAELWGNFQRQNREQMDSINPLREAELARLSSSPMQTLSVAMIFEACLQAKRGGPWNHRISVSTLLLAINHVEACLAAAGRLDMIGNRSEIAQNAEVLLSKIRLEFPAVQEFHFATRSELTKRFCPNSTRAGSWQPDDLYLRIIPHLEGEGQACLVSRIGKREIYAFRVEPA